MRRTALHAAVIVALSWFAIGEDVSAQPRPTREQIAALSFLNGSWLVQPSLPTPEGEWKEHEDKGFAEFEFTLDRNIIEGELTPLPPFFIHERMFITYDVVRNFYRVLSMDDYWGWVLIMTGEIKDGALDVNNVGTSSSWHSGEGDGWTDTRMQYEPIDENHVRITRHLSNDGGETWKLYDRLDLTRRYER